MDDQHDLVVRTIREHASALLRTARKHSLCLDDAHDAYQRGLEIFLRRASTIDPRSAARWLHVVIKHEALAIRRARGREVATDDASLDARPAGGVDDDERVLRFDRLARSAEALARLKPQEVRALWLKAQGLSYAEIAEHENWTYTKVNRCLTEGRRSFLDRYAAIERGDECRRWASVVSAIVDGEATAEQLAAARPHLRRCAACRATIRELQAAGPRLAGVLPLGPGIAAAGAGASFSPGGAVDGLARALESVATAVQERASAWAVKVQLAAEAASGAKVAAVAASAVAVAGGGAVTVAEVRESRGGGDRAARVAAARPGAGAPAPAPASGSASAASAAAGVARVRARAGASAVDGSGRPGPGEGRRSATGGPIAGEAEFSFERGSGRGGARRGELAAGVGARASAASARTSSAGGVEVDGERSRAGVDVEAAGAARVDVEAAGAQRLGGRGGAGEASAAREAAPPLPGAPSAGIGASARADGGRVAGEFDPEG